MDPNLARGAILGQPNQRAESNRYSVNSRPLSIAEFRRKLKR